MSKKKMSRNGYQGLINSIGILLHQARQEAFRRVNSVLVGTYWEISRHIVVYEQANKGKAEYGSRLLDTLSRDLKGRYGKGFSRRNVLNMRNFYLAYQKRQAVPAILSWTHIVSLLSIEETLTRSFYEKECIANKWSTRELDRQINSMLFERLAFSKNKKSILKLAAKGHQVARPADIIKNPYILEFLDLPEDHSYSEKDHVLVEYALGGISNKLFASKYRLSLPDKQLLKEAVERIIK